MINLKKQIGFTLVELALVLTIISVLAIGSTTLFTGQKESAEQSVSQARLVAVKIALLRFMEKNYYLPCPDTNGQGESGFGFENRFNAAVNVDVCSEHSGTVPFEELGLSLVDVKDAKKNLFYYAVTQGVTVASDIANCPVDSACFFNSNTAPAFNVSTEPVSGNLGAKNLELCAGTNCAGQNLLGRGIVVMVVAYNNRATSTGVSVEEAENRDGDTTFIQLSAPTESFDDSLISISGHELKRNEERTFRENTANVNLNQSFEGNNLESMGNNSVGNKGTGVGTDNVIWDEVSQEFDFGANAANKEIVLTYKTRAIGSWDQPPTPSSNVTSDTAIVSSNGVEIKTYKYDYTDVSSKGKPDGVVLATLFAGFTGWLAGVRNEDGTARNFYIVEGEEYEVYLDYWDDEVEIIVETDGSGKIDLEFAVGTTAISEVINFTDIELMYYNTPPPIPSLPSVYPISGISQTDGLE